MYILEQVNVGIIFHRPVFHQDCGIFSGNPKAKPSFATASGGVDPTGRQNKPRINQRYDGTTFDWTIPAIYKLGFPVVHVKIFRASKKVTVPLNDLVDGRNPAPPEMYKTLKK